jgi:hypothetical protein
MYIYRFPSVIWCGIICLRAVQACMLAYQPKLHVRPMINSSNNYFYPYSTISRRIVIILPQKHIQDRFKTMFTIEHEFDATVVTLIDEGKAPLMEDLIITVFASQVTVEQLDPRTDTVQKITLSLSQLRELEAALDLPEGSYQIRNPDEADHV